MREALAHILHLNLDIVFGVGWVWLNEVGTFGIGSAAYWWSRLIGAPNRYVFYVLVRSWFWQMLFADDYSWTTSGENAKLPELGAGTHARAR